MSLDKSDSKALSFIIITACIMLSFRFYLRILFDSRDRTKIELVNRLSYYERWVLFICNGLLVTLCSVNIVSLRVMGVTASLILFLVQGTIAVIVWMVIAHALLLKSEKKTDKKTKGRYVTTIIIDFTLVIGSSFLLGSDFSVISENKEATLGSGVVAFVFMIITEQLLQIELFQEAIEESKQALDRELLSKQRADLN